MRTIKIDREVYNDSAVSKCIYSLSAQMDCSREIDGRFEIVHITSYANGLTDDEAEHLFWMRLSDYHLRDIIHRETAEIRTLLYAKAFAESDDYSMEP
ncbi:MAG: His-Xaa-Ser system protein HxsD [Bacteroidales bacterium]|nr:His-Xaa-Ser system protein HxsD [Bacteroidales bacterium]